jgi:Cu-Zn family superoxide dismutase
MTGTRGMAAVGAMGMLAACGAAAGMQGPAQPRAFSQPIYDAAEQTVGQLTLRQQGRDSVRVTVEATRLPPGVHGTHLHATGRCEAPAFATA